MAKPLTTQVGKSKIPVRGIHPTLGIFFSGERGRHERGLYLFWTAVLKPPYVDNRRRLFARSRILNDPGERFRRIEQERRTARTPRDRAAYEWQWTRLLRQGRGIAYIRPATRREVNRWFLSHREDHKGNSGCIFGPPQAPQATQVSWLTQLWRRFRGSLGRV